MSTSHLAGRLRDAFEWVGDRGTSSAFGNTDGWYRDASILSALGPMLGKLVTRVPDLVIGPQSSGYILGPLVASELNAGFVRASRSSGPVADSDQWRTTTSPPDYSGEQSAFRWRESLVRSGDLVVAVDDIVETGGQLLAMKRGVEAAGARWLGAVVVADFLDDSSTRRTLQLSSLMRGHDLY